MPNYLRNLDDGVSEPDVIAARYRQGRSAFLEAQLASESDSVQRGTSDAGGVNSNVLLGTAVQGGYRPARPDPDEE